MPNQTIPFWSTPSRRIWQGLVSGANSVNFSVLVSNRVMLQPAYSANQILSFLSMTMPYGYEFLVGGSYNATTFCCARSHFPILLPIIMLNQMFCLESVMGVWP